MGRKQTVYSFKWWPIGVRAYNGEEVIELNLKNNKITVGELLDNPKAKAVLVKRFPLVMKKQPTGAACTVTLEQLIAFLDPYLPGAIIRDTIKELEKI